MRAIFVLQYQLAKLIFILLSGSSMVERYAVNVDVVGSSPAPTANWWGESYAPGAKLVYVSSNQLTRID